MAGEEVVLQTAEDISLGDALEADLTLEASQEVDQEIDPRRGLIGSVLQATQSPIQEVRAAAEALSGKDKWR